MEIFFFFVMIFSGDGHLQEVTASTKYDSWAECNKERERIYYEIPVNSKPYRRVVTQCAAMQVTALPRCQ